MQMADAIKEALAESGNELTIQEGNYELSVEKGCRSVGVWGHPRPGFDANFWMQGVKYGGGEPEFTEIAPSILTFLVEEAPLSKMTSRFPWFKAEEGALAHEQGSAEFVSYIWSSLQEVVKMRTVEASKEHARLFRGLALLIEEAAKRPELRQLRPYTSLISLGFSRTTGYPFTGDCPFARPVLEDVYPDDKIAANLHRVTSADGTVLCDRVEVVRAVDALVAAIPPDCGPAINGTASTLH